jgi:hypothetical protein
MTRISKLTAVLIATVTIGGAVISSTDSASARMRGEGMGRMHHGHGHFHRHGHGGGFGRGAMIGMGVGVAGVIIANAVAQRAIYAESYDRGTRVRVRSDKVGNDRVVITTDAKGKKARDVKKPNEPASISWTNPETGETTTITDNGDGTKTLTKTDANGKPVGKPEVVKNKTPDSASSTDRATGNTTTSTADGAGGRDVTKTDAAGKPVGDPVKMTNNEPASASSYDPATNTTTTSTADGAGGRNVTVKAGR